MRKYIIILIVLISQFTIPFLTGAQEYSIFREGLIGNIKPSGWLKECLERQANGLTGHPEAMAYPYNTCLWAGEIERKNENPVAKDWWRYEQTAYYTDGLLRIGYLINRKDFIKKGEEGIKYTIDHAQDNGRLGNEKIESLWPLTVFARAMQAKYYVTKDSRIIEALEKHYLSLDTNMLTNGRRHITNLEGILFVYNVTKNPELLKLAKQSYERGGFELDKTIASNSEPIFMHGVTYAEMLKIPMILYAHTGDTAYLEIALNAERKLERDHLLPDGLYSSAEFTMGNNIDFAHETCDITDYTWSLGYFLQTTGEAEWADRIERAIYNAGFGAITKDFKALQYFSSVNQMICTGTSDNNTYKQGKTWMAYRPIHETECCVGNINRMFPNFVSRLWLIGSSVVEGEPNSIVAALYAPNEISFEIDGSNVKISEETMYPFDTRILFRFQLDEKKRFPFKLRIPGWATAAKLKINGQNKKIVVNHDGYFLTINREFSNGDVVELNLDTDILIKDIEGQGRYVERGPLLFTYPIPHKKVEDSTNYENMNGKKSENPDFKSWNYFPDGPFNYAIDQDLINGNQLRIKTKKEIDQSAYPFDIENIPISINLPVSEIIWDLDDGVRNPLLPKKDDVKKIGGTKEIKLIPYGCTELRLTVFPVLRK